MAYIYELYSIYKIPSKKMRLLLCLSLVVILNMFCQNRNKMHCEDFKTGNFKIHTETNNLTYSITRNETKQVEKEQETGKQTEWRIRWLNECEYKLLLIKDNFGLLTSGQLKAIPEFTYKIITTTKDYYIFETRSGPSMPLITDTIFRSK